jgi:hypothetical protein
MSWLFGYFGDTNPKEFASPESPLYSFKNSNLILFAGRNKQTCFFQSDSPDSCWAVAGVGLKQSEECYKILYANDWKRYLDSDKIDLSEINGHYVVVKYSEDKLLFFTDELGLREVYTVKLDKGFGFTTRIDWLKYFINVEIDVKEFSSRWLLQNQISRKSIIKNVVRLVSAKATIKNNFLLIEQNYWKPDFDSVADQNLFDSSLRKLISIQDRKISLSLSGGLDSRLLLSYLALKNFDKWDTHTFGDPDHPDSKIASQLLKCLNLKNEIIDDKLPGTEQLTQLVKDYSVHTIVTNPISSILNLRFYNRMNNGNKVIIDGGFGEIWRRAFASRILLIGRNALLKKNIKTVSGFLRYYRADIFSDEALAEMEKGIIEQFEELLSEMPDANQIGPEKWIDLFSVRYRLTNYYEPEQTRLDQYVISYMPLVQKDILNLLFGLNESEKKNSKLFRQLIKRNAIQLTKQPLVKGNIIHPFNSSSLGTRVHSRIKNKLGLSYQSKLQIEFQDTLREFIGDVIQSVDVRNYMYYDRRKLEWIGNDFMSKSTEYNSEIDWFLSFELFRQGILK